MKFKIGGLMKGRYIPSSTKFVLRKEAHYGCAICGSPIIEYHHIVPYHICKKHDPEDMIVLCPEHHHRADCEEIDRERLYVFKKKPFNSNVQDVQKDFFLSKYDDLILNIGTNTFCNVRTPVQINGIPIISVNKDERGYSLLNVKFFNSHAKLLAEVDNNVWKAYRPSQFWDIIYRPGHLKIYREKGNIQLEIEIVNELVKIYGQLYIGKHKVIFAKNETLIMTNQIINSTIKNANVGISTNIKDEVKYYL